MSPDGSIAAQRIWKRFRPDRKNVRLSYELGRLARRLGGRGLDWTWALRDVDLVAAPGEAVGLVGNNGSGKSTLLKIVNRVMFPHAGHVEVVGRVGALIEVKAGISPELTGRENVHLYGTLLGLKRADVARRFDEIVAFAQLESSIDRYVKYYSSGMQMRLGFSVAAHLDPAILLVDEVLAVGDAAFQQRCLDRMRAVINQGTTLVFVSHDLAAVQSISTRGIWLRDGIVEADGPVEQVLTAYRRGIEADTEIDTPRQNDGPVRLDRVRIANPDGETLLTQGPAELVLHLDSDAARTSTVIVGVSEGTADPIFVFRRQTALVAGTTEIRCTIPRLPLPRGRFFVFLSVADTNNKRDLVAWQPVASLDVYGPDLDAPPKAVVRRAPIHVECHWAEATGNGSPDDGGGDTRAAGTPAAKPR